MSLLTIKQSLEAHLALMNPTIQTAYEGSSFTPTPNVPYQRVQLIPRKPLNNTLGDMHYQEVGELQVFLCYPVNTGMGDVLLRATQLRTHFKRGTSLVKDGLTTIITVTPQISGSAILGDRVVVPVFISYSTEIDLSL